MNNTYKEYSNTKHITIGDYIQLYGQNDKTEIIIYNKNEEELFNGRVDYLQYTSEGCMHDLCELEIKAFLDSNEILVEANNYKGRKGIY